MSPIAEVGSAFVSVVPTTKGFGPQLESGVGGDVKSSGSRLGGLMGGALKAGALGALAGLGILAGKAVSNALDFEAGTSKLTAQLGLTSKESARVGKVSGDLFGQGFGTGMDQVQESIKSVILNIDGMRGASEATLGRISGKVTNTANIFDQDLGGVTRGVSQLMRTGLAKDADQALDIITKGFQSGADKSEDFLDTLNEYGTQFRKVGIDGKMATGLISQGLKAGARDGDLVADSIKEFSIRAVDGSDATQQGFQAIGLNAGKMAAQIAKGGPAAQKGLDTVLDRLRGMKNPTDQAAAATKLFGTQAEDMGKALFALDPSKAVGALGKVKGAADKAGEAFNDNAKARISTFFRGMQQAATNAIGGVLLPALAKLGPVLTDLGSFISTNISPVLQRLSATFTAVVLPAITSLGSYLAARLFPIFQQVWSIIATKVVPIIASLARFLYGTLVPAVIGIVTAVAQRLKPVFDQLVATLRANVYPAIAQLLTKFHEIQPTLQKVISIVVTVIGWVLKLAASILGKVLPVVIKFAGFLIKVLVGAIVGVINIIQKVNGWIDGLAGAITRGVAKVKDFAGTLQNLAQRGLDVVLNAISQLPGKIMALGGKFLEAGRGIIGKFVDGLQNAGGVVSGIAGNVWDALRGMINSAINQINAALDFTVNIPGPDIHIDAPNIPTLAAGGIATRGTLAVVGEGREDEAIMPLSRLSAMLDRERSAGAGAGRAVFHIYDRDDVLLGTMEGVADGRIHGANQLAGETARAM